MTLARRLTLTDAVGIGLGSMIGAGVFAVWGSAFNAAGSGIFLALAIAAAVATCNAASSAQLASVHPIAGGTYSFARIEIGPWWGFIAGWCFLVGKVASCAAMAVTFAAYAAPAAWRTAVAVAAVVALVVVNCLGVTRTARVTQILVGLSLAGLAVVVGASAFGQQSATPTPLPDGTLYGVLQGAGLLFFAFAGYARIATLGEEVRNPRTTIPRAVILALTSAVVVYAAVGATVLLILGGAAVGSDAPLRDVMLATVPSLAPVVQITAALASLGALLALMTGLGRTTMAMARYDDLPHYFSKVSTRWQVPYRAEILIGAVIVSIVLAADLREAIAFSSFGVLLYYFITNIAAFRQTEGRWTPRALQVVGAVGCLALTVTLPPIAGVVALAFILTGVAGRSVRLALRREKG